MPNARNPPSAPRQSYYFACVLYPEDSMQCKFLKWLTEQKEIQMFYILHDKDVDTSAPQGEGIVPLKKAHWHVVVKFPTRKSVKGASSYSANMIHWELVSDQFSYAKYLTHEDFASTLEGKHKYELSDIRGNESGLKLYMSLIGNDSFVQSSLFVQFSQMLKESDGELVEAIPFFLDNVDGADFLRQYQGLISTMSNQEFRKHYHKMVTKEERI